MNRRLIKIKNIHELYENINSNEKYQRVLSELKRDNIEINNNQLAVNYSDEGYAFFEVKENTFLRLVLEFTGTGS